jgi:hypothetical protein
LLALALIPIGMGASYGPFWSMPSLFLAGEAAASVSALIVWPLRREAVLRGARSTDPA